MRIKYLCLSNVLLLVMIEYSFRPVGTYIIFGQTSD